MLMSVAPSSSTQWYVAAGGQGNGSSTAPFGRVQDALNVAQPGDMIVVAPGTFNESIRSVRDGSTSLPITVRAANGRGSVMITASGRVLTVAHAYIAVEGLVLDGQYGADDLVRLSSAATGFRMVNTEVRRSENDAIDMGAVQDVMIENSLIHHALNPANGRTDAHGIVGGAVQRLTVRNTEIHTFSGDGIQIDPGRASPGWNDVTVEGCRIWLAPLPADEHGFVAGMVPGENAVDTKTSESNPRARITVRNTEAWGFKWATSNNLAAFNLKESIDATVDGVTAHDSEIGFRLRGPAWVRIQNAVVYDTDVGFRYEDNIQNLRIWNSTLGNNVARSFVAASSSASVLDVRNLLLLGSALPSQASGSSNLAAVPATFLNATGHDYQLVSGAAAIDSGVTIPDVTTDRQGTRRPQGAAYDVGAYERVAGGGPNLPVAPPAPANLRILR